MSEKLVLIDGHSILNRAFYGVPDLTNLKGLHTNAVYGFLNILFKILEEEKPDYLAVAFDVKAPTFRHIKYADYKGTRKPMPEELREQVPVMKELLKAMGVVIVEQAGFEADDILGTLAKKAEGCGHDVSLVSGDRDLLQIATDKIKIRIPKTKGGKTEIEDYYAEDVVEKYQVTPEQFIELKALMGDTADNVPGVPKVGEKTATNLMVTYGSIDGIYEHIEEIKGNSVRQSLMENKELADLSKFLVTIKTDCDVNLEWESARAEHYFTKEAYMMMKELEFKNLLTRFDSSVSEDLKGEKPEFCILTDLAETEAFFEKCKKQELGVYLLREEIKSSLAGLAIATKEKVTFLSSEGLLTGEYLCEKMKELSKSSFISVFDIKKSYDFLAQDTAQNYFDILIGAYLLNPLKNNFEIPDIAATYLNLELPGKSEIFGKEKIEVFYEKEQEKAVDYACYVAYVCLLSKKILSEKLEETGMLKLMEEIEMPLSLVLYSMEQEGVRVKPEELEIYSKTLGASIEKLEKSIYEKAGLVFNINSPKQLGEVLFEKLQIPGGKKTKTGYSTAVDVLEKLTTEYPIVADILEYRGLAKLKSTYADGLAVFIDEGNRIHTTFNQTITATGRISSTEPNLQNIPMKTELGRQIRKVFVPKDGFVFMDADYSQIELRILAHMSGDSQLIDAYKMNEDIHRITASKVFHTPFEEVTDLQRRNAKAVNFGIVYGISSFGLSQDLSISKKEAGEYINQYFATYPGVKKFLDETVEKAKQDGYVTTLFGRRRPEIGRAHV